MILSILIIVIVLSLAFWGMNLTPTACSTRELHRLNKILEDFNEDKDVLNAKLQVEKYDWKYHPDKVDFIRQVIGIYKNGNSKND